MQMDGEEKGCDGNEKREYFTYDISQFGHEVVLWPMGAL